MIFASRRVILPRKLKLIESSSKIYPEELFLYPYVFSKGFAFLGNPLIGFPKAKSSPGRFVAMQSIAYYHS